MTIRSRRAQLTLFSVALLTATCAFGCRQQAGDATDRDAGAQTPMLVSFPTDDGGVVFADEYGAGDRAVVLAHGGRFTKESWADQAPVIAADGFRVLAIDFRGRGKSGGGSQTGDGEYLDVLAAIRYLRDSGAKNVAVIGASFGGWAAAVAFVASKPGEIDKLVLLAASSIDEPERLTCPKLFIAARDDVIGDGDPRFPLIQALFDRAPEPKKLIALDGSAHAQFIFQTDQADRLLGEIRRFLAES
jgi:pimeloyl-ACP methyl ester carboxylesterase